MIKSSTSLLPGLLLLQQSGVCTDTVLVGQGGRVMVHWAVLARWSDWRVLREEGERGLVTIILPGVDREELMGIVEKAYGYGEVKDNPMMDEVSLGDEISNQIIISGETDEKTVEYQESEYKMELDAVGDIEGENSFDEDVNEESVIDRFTKELPDYIYCC